VNHLLKLFGVSKSTFYERIQMAAKAQDKYAQLRSEVSEIFSDSRETAGQRTIQTLLKTEGIEVSRYLIRKTMHQENMHSKQRRPKPYKLADKPSLIAPNILGRQFSPLQPNTHWCGDVTYIWTQNGWCYCAAVMDLFARKIVGMAVSHHPDSDLTLKALTMAFESRGRPENLIFHSDQGCHYTSEKYRNELSKMGITQSMSRRGNCWDNAPMERFFGSLKSEWVPKLGYENLSDADCDLHLYVHHKYNCYRPHTYNRGLSPDATEAVFRASKVVL
jgi:putative transposase